MEREVQPQGDDFTDQERMILRDSADLEVTRRRIRTSVASSGVLILALLVAGLTFATRELLLLFAVAYVAVAAYERVAYGKAVLLYKSTIQKLSRSSADKKDTGSPS